MRTTAFFRHVAAGVGSIALVASLGVAPVMAAPPYYDNMARERSSDSLRADGNDTVEFLYDGAPSTVPRPSELDIWPSGNINDSLNIQPNADMQTCSVTMMGQYQSRPMSATGIYADVDRDFAQTTPAVSSYRFAANPQLENGYMITRAATSADSPESLTQSGRVKVTSADAGHLTLAMDGWTNQSGVNAKAGEVRQHARLRLATKEPIQDFRLVMRLDDVTDVTQTVNQMANWNGWWAPGYTQAPTQNFRITYSTDADGTTYAIITAAEVPANSWATVTFHGVVTGQEYATGGQLYSYSAATASFTTLRCEAPTPFWEPQSILRGTSVEIANTGDTIPQFTPPATATATVDASAAPGWNVTVDAVTGLLRAQAPATAAAGAYEFPVTITYGDGTSRVVTATVNVLPTPVYTDLSVAQGSTASTPAPLLDHTGEPMPDDVTYAAAPGTPDWVTITEDGIVTVNPAVTIPEGGYPVSVVVTHPNGTTETVNLAVRVLNPNDPLYTSATLNQGSTVTVPTPTNPDGSELPAGSTFAPGASVPDWITVNPDGTVVAAPGHDVPAGSYTATVEVTYPDGSTETTSVVITVVNPNDANSLGGTVRQGESVTVPAPANLGDPTNPDDDVALPDGTTFEAGPGTPSWVTVNENGSVTASPGSDVAPINHVITVVVTYPDGSTENVTVPITVLNPNTPDYQSATLNQGSTVTVPTPTNPDSSVLPAGSTFAPGAGVPGWITVNEDGSVTAAPGTDVPAGSYTANVEVTYPDDTTATTTVVITVINPNDASSLGGTVRQGAELTIDPPANLGDPANPDDDVALPDGTLFAGRGGTPSWVTVNENGSVTATPGFNVAPGVHEIVVLVLYPDGSTEDVIVPITVVNPNDPLYTSATVNQGAEATVPAPMNTDGSPLPAGSTFATGEGVPAWITVNEDGSVTARPPHEVEPTAHTFPIVVTYPDGTTDTTSVTFTVVNANDPVYQVGVVKQGETVTVPAPATIGDPADPSDDVQVPPGTTFDRLTAVLTWITVNEADGTITASPDATVAPGVYTGPIDVIYPDGTVDRVWGTIVVVNPNKPAYEDSTVVQGETITVPTPANPDGTPPLPEGTRFAPGDDVPDWITVNADGTLTASPTVETAPLKHSVSVVVTYPDETTAIVPVDITVVNPNRPVYENGEVNQGDTLVIPAAVNENGSALPEGTSYSFAAGMPGWITVDPEDDRVVAAPGHDVPAGDYTVLVIVTYPDGSTTRVPVVITVVNPNAPVYEDSTVVQGQQITVPTPANPNGLPLPDGTTYAAGDDVPTWVTVNADGTLTAAPADDLEPGAYTADVVVTYPDGSTQTRTATITVVESDENSQTPGSGTTTVDQGETATVPAPTNEDGTALPEGTTFTPGDEVPDWVTVNEDGTVTATPGSDVAPGPHDVDVVVTYPDGSSETITVVITVNNPNTPVAETGTVNQGDTLELSAPVNEDGSPLPEGTTYGPGDGVPSWVTVNADGTVTATPGSAVTPGGYGVEIVVSYPDGTTEEIIAIITVVNPNAPMSEGGRVDQGDSITIPAPTNPDGTPLPEGSTYAPGEDVPGWVTVNPDGTVEAAPSSDVAPGPHTVTVTATHPDGTTRSYPVVITVTNPNAAVAGSGTVDQGETITIPTPTNRDGSELPDGTTYGPGGGVPSWVTVNEDGTLTVAPGAEVAPGGYGVEVVVSYPDGTSETITVVITVTNPNRPDYEDAVVTQGQSVTIPAPVNADGSSLPDGTTFAPGDGVPSWVTVNEDGTLTAAPGTDVVPEPVTVAVVVTYPDGTTGIVTVVVTVVATEGSVQNPVSEGGTVDQGETVTVPAPANPDGTPLPDGTTFAPGDTVPDWVTVNEDGSVTASPGSDVVPGPHAVEVVVTYPDGSSESVHVVIIVTNPNDAVGGSGRVNEGETVTVPAPTNADGSSLPEGTTFAPGNDVPDWVTVNEDGTVVASPGTDVSPGGYGVEVVVTYPDGTTETVIVTITVVNPNAPVSDGGAVDQGGTITIPTPANPDGTPLPEGTTFTPGDNVPDWVTVNEDGSVTASPGSDVAPGPHTVELVVSYPDGSSESAHVVIIVTNPNDAVGGSGRVNQGETVTVPAPTNADGSSLPEGTTFAPGNDVPDWVTVNEDGTVEASPGTDVSPGGYGVEVVVTYPDGTTETVIVTITVVNANVPVYEAGTVEQGETVTVPTPANPDGTPLPEGTTFAPGDNVPGWVTVNEDGTVTAAPGTDVEPGAYTIAVVITYPDGTTQTVTTTITVVAVDAPPTPGPTDPPTPGPTDPPTPGPTDPPTPGPTDPPTPGPTDPPTPGPTDPPTPGPTDPPTPGPTDPPTPGPSDDGPPWLASTGINAGVLAGVAVLLLAAGAGLLAVRPLRKGRTSH